MNPRIMDPRTLVLLWSVGLLGCNGDKESIPEPSGDDSGGNVDTDTDTASPDDTGDPPPCTAVVEDIIPISGDDDWFYLDPMQLKFSESVADRLGLSILDGEGTAVPVQATFDKTGLVAEVLPTGGRWEASTSYNVAIDLCDTQSSVSFLTTEYGDPLTDAPEGLEGRSFYVDMGEATYTDPPGVGAVISLFLSDPLIIGVVAADAAEITVIGAQGIKDEVTGNVTQNLDYSTWDFGTADFTSSPYFSATSAQTTFGYGNADIPVYDFSFEGTFNPSATQIGGTRFRGLGDTREMGPLLNLGNAPDATCTLLTNYGIECETCPDGNKYCLTLAGYFEDALLVEGLTVVPVD